LAQSLRPPCTLGSAPLKLVHKGRAHAHHRCSGNGRCMVLVRPDMNMNRVAHSPGVCVDST